MSAYNTKRAVQRPVRAQLLGRSSPLDTKLLKLTIEWNVGWSTHRLVINNPHYSFKTRVRFAVLEDDWLQVPTHSLVYDCGPHAF